MTFIRRIRTRRPETTEYPFDVAAVQQIETLDLDHPVIILVGENGSGKSTVVEALAVAAGLNPEGGSRQFSFETRPSHSVLADHLTLIRGATRENQSWFLRSESYFTAATYLERLPDGPWV